MMETKQKHKGLTVVITLVLAILLPLLSAPVTFAEEVESDFALKIDDTEYSTSDLNFVTANNFFRITQIPAFTPEGQMKLNEMVADEKGNMRSIREVLIDAARSQLQDVHVLLKQAKEANMELDEADAASVEKFFENINNYAKAQNTETDEVLRNIFGPEATEESIRPLLEDTMLVSSYQRELVKNYEFEEKELEDLYQEKPEEFDLVSFRSLTFHAIDPSEQNVEEEQEEADMESLMKEASAKANDFLKKIKDEESFIKEAIPYVPADLQEALKGTDFTLNLNQPHSVLQKHFAEWLFDKERKEGDTVILESPSAYSVLYFINRGRDETPVFSARHLLFQQDLMAEDQEAAKGEVLKLAGEAKKEFEEGEQSEEAFTELVLKYSDDEYSAKNGGLYENILPGTVVPEFENWCLDPARKEGEVGMIYVEAERYSGAHLIYFLGLGNPSWQARAKEILREDRFIAELDKAREELTIVEGDGYANILQAATEESNQEEVVEVESVEEEELETEAAESEETEETEAN